MNYGVADWSNLRAENLIVIIANIIIISPVDAFRGMT